MERLHRQGKHDILTDLLKRIRDQGVLVGLSAHDPRLIEVAEEAGWDVDYYMGCLYYLTRPKDELRKLLGDDLPLGEIYLPSDPPRMFEVIRSVKKPCLVYKVLAAGRRVVQRAWEQGARVVLESIAGIQGVRSTNTLVAVPILPADEDGERDRFSAWD